MIKFGGEDAMTAEDFLPENQKEGFSSFISGGISGAITNPYSEEAEEHAKLYYEEIRHSTTDHIKIANNINKMANGINYTPEKILRIKAYLFLEPHMLEGETKLFVPSFEIAQSWQRLAYDPNNIKPHDLTLLKHEDMEMALVDNGLSQSEAHDITEKTYNYKAESIEYYKTLGYNPAEIFETYKDKNSGGIKTTNKKANWEERY